MKEWLSGRDLAQLQLADLPQSQRGLYSLIEREGWNNDPSRSRKRLGQGGGYEYRVSALPELARLDYAKRQMNAAAKGARGACAQMAAEGDLVDGRGGEERDARLQIIATCDRFRLLSKMSVTVADDLFVQLYNKGEIDVSAWVKETVKKVSMRSMARWRAASRQQQSNTLAHDPSQSRRGTSVLDRACDGQVRTTLLALIAENPHFKAKHLRDYVSDQYGASWEVTDAQGEVKSVAVPPVRTFQHTIARWKDQYASELLKLQDPDGYRSKHQFALRVGAQAEHLNQLWQIDASPCDVMTIDGGKTGKQGRPNLYACIDVYSRRTVFLVSTTPTASALGLLIRKALLAWGVPSAIKSDNGADFTAKHIERLLDNLGIHHDLCTPFQPQQKGMVERVFRTLQHDLMVTLPGFVGHNVADRNVIESRKGFAHRLGEQTAALAGVELTNQQLAERIDAWTRDEYEQRPHGSLRDRSPFEVAASAKGPVRTIESKDALRILLAPVPGGDGIRTVTKTGVRIAHVDYYSAAAMPGDRVLCRMDPADMGRVWLFEPDGQTFLGEAVSPELSGHDPADIIARVKEAQKVHIAEGTAPLRREARRIKPLDIADALARQTAQRAGNLVAFPKPKSPHSTAALEAAGQVAHSNNPKELPADAAALHQQMVKRAEITGSLEPLKVKPIREDTRETRFKRALLLQERMASGSSVKAEDALWLGRYEAGSEYRAMQKMVADFGEQMLGEA